MNTIQNMSFNELKRIAREYKLPGKSKKELVSSIKTHYNELKKWVKYSFIKQLGTKGKDGRTFLVKDDKRNEYALKLFTPTKKNSRIQKEVDLQMIAAKGGVAPKVVDYDVDGKYIVMEKLNTTLYDYFVKQNGQLTIEQQKAVVRLFKKLDKCGILHNDPNPLNVMKKGKRWYMIDYGMSKKISPMVLERWGKTPNLTCMTIGLIVQLRGVYADAKLEYLERFIDEKFRKK